LALAAVVAMGATGGDYATVQRKIDLIQQERTPAGSSVALKKDELNAYIRREVAEVAQDAVREPRLELGANRATGFAYVDFARLQQSDSRPVRWIMARLIGGERSVRVDARIRSGGGKAVVEVERVEISGMNFTGGALDFLIRKFLWSYYPDAKVGQPFELAHRIDRFEVDPREVRVVIGR